MSAQEGSMATEASEEAAQKKTPLYGKHVQAEARFVSFAGWEMPLQYKEGIIREHLHTRSEVGLFDTSHMGEIFVKGPQALQLMERLLTNRVESLAVGRARYCMILNERGGILDDLIVFRTKEDEFMLVVNAGTREKDFEWIRSHAGDGVEVRDQSSDFAKVDVQGPKSLEVLDRILAPLTGEAYVSTLRPFRFGHFTYGDVQVLASRTGYTGELGCELFITPSRVESLWDAILEVESVRPAGLGARDTLRLEKGLRLYGNDIDETRTPLEANLGRFVDLEKDFIGRYYLLQQRDEGVKELMTGFVSDGRRTARAGFEVKSGGVTVGNVTSGAFSPCLECGAGLCYIDAQWARDGQDLVLTDGRREIHARVVSLPIVK